MKVLTTASTRYMRNDDQAFPSLQDMLKVLLERDQRSREETHKLGEIYAVALQQGGIGLGIGDDIIQMNPWSFSQVCSLLHIPTKFGDDMATHNPQLMQQVMEFAIKQELQGRKAYNAAMKEQDRRGRARLSERVYLEQNGGPALLRAITSDKYARGLDTQIIRTLIEHSDDHVIPAGYVAGTHGQAGARRDDGSGRYGLYASDRDSFWFLVNQDDPIDSGGETIFRGLIVWNSEVGSKRAGVMEFMYRFICQNHMIWGAEQIQMKSYIHIGDNINVFMRELPAIVQRLNSRSNRKKEVADVIAAAERALFASTDDDDAVIEKLAPKVGSKKASKKVLEMAKKDSDETTGHNPRSVWGVVQGITRLSQEKAQFNDQRYALDAVGGAILSDFEAAL